MKLAVAGKGGAGKTTLTSVLADTFAARGYDVLAVDADPSPCLATALGFPAEMVAGLPRISELKEIIEERTGGASAAPGPFRLNPAVDDLLERFSAVHRGIRLLQLGAMEQGGKGCICAESTLLRALVRHTLLRRREVVLMDMYAGVEHLGRATTDSVDAMLIVVEPTERTLATAARIRDLAEDIGLGHLFLVGNKVDGEADRQYIAANARGLPIAGFLPFDRGAREAEWARCPASLLAPALTRAVARTLDTLLSQLGVEPQRISTS
jgi:CO dehydrogenase maturation factor